jgi:transcriptional regulator with XRE-family HTH domain
MHIGDAIKLVRKSKYMSQVQLADKAGITQAALSQIENGTRPGVDTLNAIAKALEAPQAALYLLTLDVSDFPKSKQALFKALWPTMKHILHQLCE